MKQDLQTMADSKHVIDTDRRNTISTADKVAALEHIHYEFQMYIDLSMISVSGCTPLANAALEAWLIHLRTLNEFLSPLKKRQPRTYDVRPEHYGVELSVPFLSDTLKERLDKEVAHITYRRHTDPIAKRWEKAVIFRDTWPILCQAIDQLLLWARRHANATTWGIEFMELQRRGREVYAHVTEPSNTAQS